MLSNLDPRAQGLLALDFLEEQAPPVPDFLELDLQDPDFLGLDHQVLDFLCQGHLGLDSNKGFTIATHKDQD